MTAFNEVYQKGSGSPVRIEGKRLLKLEYEYDLLPKGCRGSLVDHTAL